MAPMNMPVNPTMLTEASSGEMLPSSLRMPYDEQNNVKLWKLSRPQTYSIPPIKYRANPIESRIWISLDFIFISVSVQIATLDIYKGQSSPDTGHSTCPQNIHFSVREINSLNPITNHFIFHSTDKIL